MNLLKNVLYLICKTNKLNMVTLIKRENGIEWSKQINEKYINTIKSYDSSTIRVILIKDNPYNVESIECKEVKYE